MAIVDLVSILTGGVIYFPYTLQYQLILAFSFNIWLPLCNNCFFSFSVYDIQSLSYLSSLHSTVIFSYHMLFCSEQILLTLVYPLPSIYLPRILYFSLTILKTYIHKILPINLSKRLYTPTWRFVI